MAFDFPNTPADGAMFTPIVGGPSWTWSAAGGVWQFNSAGVNAGVAISDSPPANPIPGQLWWQSSTGNTFIWYADPNSSQWVQFNVGPATGKGITDGSNPAAGQVGEFMVNTGTGSPGSGTPSTLVGLTLTAGDWEVWGHVYCTSSTVGLGQFLVCLNTTAGALNLNQAAGYSASSGALFSTNSGIETPRIRYNVTTTTNVYVVVQVTYASGTTNLNSTIWARRMR
jgi:hypothetical protein